MSAIKDSIDNISDDTNAIIKDHKKLIMLRFTEKFSLVLGIIMSVIVISTLILIIVLFGSFSLGGFLNRQLNSQYLGYIIVTGFYLFIIIILFIKLVKYKRPLLTNLFVKFIVFILDVDIQQDKTLRGLRQEKENIHVKLEADKTKIKADFQMLRYGFMESILKDFIGLFTSGKKRKKAGGTNSTDSES